jgi:succinoglycan biosynthesis protein ExoU
MPVIRDDSVCVCIAAYNAEGTIARAVTSALRQSHVAEVIVVDDASTDATAEAARRCDDGSGRLTVVVLERNGGPSTARNRAIERSQAAIFCVLDSDDYFLGDRIGRLLAAGGDDWDLLADDILIVPETLGDSLTVEQPGPAPRIPRVLDLSTFVLSNISRPLEPRAELGFLKPLIRRRFLDERALRYDPGLRLGEDYALYVRALMAGATFKIVGFHGYVAVERASSLSSRHRAADLDAIRAFDAACREQAGLDAAARQALAAHELATADKLALAQALEIRREKGIGPALRFLSQQPRSIRYVASEIFRARAARFRRRLLGETRGAAETGARLLIGQKAIA